MYVQDYRVSYSGAIRLFDAYHALFVAAGGAAVLSGTVLLTLDEGCTYRTAHRFFTKHWLRLESYRYRKEI